MLAGCQNGYQLLDLKANNTPATEISSSTSGNFKDDENKSEWLQHPEHNHGAENKYDSRKHRIKHEETPDVPSETTISQRDALDNPTTSAIPVPEPMDENRLVPVNETDHNNQEENQAQYTEENDSNRTISSNNQEEYSESTSSLPTPLQLMGIKIGDSINQLLQLHGDAKQQYTIDDENNPITVYVYDGFEVGVNASQTIEYVDVYSPEVDPGLNGLHIHQTVDDAVQALGSPDTNTQFVLNYFYDNLVLKMDIDPVNNNINSIKLFALK